MRDVETLQPGEVLTIVAGTAPLARGPLEWRDGQTVAIGADWQTFTVDVANPTFDVYDRDGEIVGVVIEDGPLPTLIPDLE